MTIASEILNYDKYIKNKDYLISNDINQESQGIDKLHFQQFIALLAHHY